MDEKSAIFRNVLSEVQYTSPRSRYKIMSNTKKISIVMCSYNGEKYIKEQLDSILAQSYPIYEIIVQDDGSTDHTWNILQEYQQKYSVIHCFKNEENVGVETNFKTAFFRASGDYIAPSDQDDIWFEHKIETLIKLIDDKMLAFSRSKTLYDDGSLSEYPFTFPQTAEQSIWKRVMAGHSCLFHKSMLPYIKQSIGIDICYDFSICQIGYALNSCIHTDENLQIWRRHSGALTKSVMSNNNNVLNNIKTERGKIAKLKYTVKNLIAGNKSVGIKKYFTEIADFQKRIKGKNHIIKLCYSLANQSLYNYFVAAWICLIYRRKFFPGTTTNTFKQQLAFISFSFRYPFVFWSEEHLFEDL